MVNRIEPSEKVRQKSICFKNRQIEFMEKYPEFNPHVYCQKAMDEQIEYIDRRFLKKDEKETNGTGETGDSEGNREESRATEESTRPVGTE